MKRVQADFKIPHNGKSHTSPSTGDEIQKLRRYLEDNKIQTFCLDREGEECTKSVRDLFIEGLKYAHTASAFKNFWPVLSKAAYHSSSNTTQPEHEGADGDTDAEDCEDPCDDLDEGLETVTMDDILADEEEFPPDMDLEEAISTMQNLARVLSTE